MELALSYDNKILQFPNLPITAGITTTLMGDFEFSSLKPEININILQHITKTKYYKQLIPTHGNNTANFTSNNSSLSAIGDAAIYGNEEIGYLCLIHCSRITLSKEILYHVFEKLDKIDFWNFGTGPKAFIYPGICQSCYEVSYETMNALLSSVGDNYLRCFFPLSGKHWLFDIREYIRIYITTTVAIDIQDICTIPSCSAHSLFPDSKKHIFYSYRARQDTKRNAVFAKLPKDDKLILSITGDCPYLLLYALPN